MALRNGVGYTPSSTTVKWIQQLPDGGLANRQSIFTNTGPGANLLDKEQFERRYGVGTFTRKQWLGGDNELWGAVAQALTHHFQKGRLGDMRVYDGQPTRLEFTDAMATGEAVTLVRQFYVEADLQGVRKENPIKRWDTSRPYGDLWTERSPYWKLDLWYLNVAKAKPTQPAPVPTPPEPTPTPTNPDPDPAPATPIDQRARELQSMLADIARTIPAPAFSGAALHVVRHPHTVVFLARAVELYRAVLLIRRKLLND